MEKFIEIIIELLLIASFILNPIHSSKLHGCHIDDSTNIATCTSIPQCNEDSNLYFKKVKKIVYYNQIDKIESQAFANCVFNNSLNEIELIFNSINEIQDFAFQNMNIEPNTKLCLIINGDVHNKQLIIKPYAFRGLNINKNSNLYVEISNYKQLNIESALVEDILQDENSIVNFNLKSNDEVLFFNNTKIDINLTKLTKNITFKIEVLNSKRVFIDESKFQYLTVDALSEFSLIICETNEVYIAKNAFSSLTVSYKAKFSVYIKKANSVVLGEGVFQNLIQEDYSLFLFLIQDLENNNETSTTTTADFCFYIPENFMKNIKQNRNALLQIHFIDFHSHFIKLAEKSLTEIFMNDDSKIQIYFKDIDKDIIFQNETISYLQATNGYFEILIENHADKITPYSSNPVSFILNPNAISTIYLSSRSYFRIGFHNSNSMFNFYETSLNNVHIDSFAEEPPDYRTKLTIEVKNSPNFRMNFDGTNINNNNDNKAKIPVLIEIDDYMPLLNILNDTNDTFETVVNSYSYNSKYSSSQNNLLQYELCQYSKVKSYLEKNLVFFSNANKLTKKNVICSSCLFLYLYRYVHRRQDFYYVKDHLPGCFINLLYKEFSFDDKSLLAIDEKINKYWLLQKCDVVTGMRSMNDTKSEKLIERNICSKYFPDKQTSDVGTSGGKCLSVSMNFEKNNKNTSFKSSNNDNQRVSSVIALIFVAIIAIICFLIILNEAYKRQYCAKPCIHVNLGKNKNLKLFNIIKLFSDDGECEKLEDDDDMVVYDLDLKKVAVGGSDENIKLCKIETSKVKKFVSKSIFKTAAGSKRLAKLNDYQTIPDGLGRYQTLNQEEMGERKRKKSVNVLYDVGKNKTSLVKTFNEDDGCDEEMKLKTNPLHDLESTKKKNKAVDV
jgi:hypothetical protein